MGLPGRTEFPFLRLCIIDRHDRDRGFAAAESRHAPAGTRRPCDRSESLDMGGLGRYADDGLPDVLQLGERLSLQSRFPIQDALPPPGVVVPFHIAPAGRSFRRPPGSGKAGRSDVASAMERGCRRRPNACVRVGGAMPIAVALRSIESTGLSTAIREGAFLYPILGGIHL